MLRLSARSWARRFFPREGGRKQILALAGVACVASCGGSGARPPQRVAGAGYSFLAPGSWDVVRKAHTIEASPGDERLVSVALFPLAKPYRPGLWTKVVPDLDRVARGLAGELHGTAPDGRTLVVAGRRARTYEIAYVRDGRHLVEEITFLLVGRREYELLCRRSAGARLPACAQLRSGFRPA